MFRERHQCPCSIGDIRGRNGYRVGQPLRVHGKMSLIPRYLLARVITLLFRGICSVSSVAHECQCGRRKLTVKVVDIFGTDTMTIVEVTV